MIVITRATLDMNTLQWTAVESHDYDGPVALCKGDEEAKAAKQNQLDFQKMLMSSFQQQFAKQNQVFQFLRNTLKPMIKNPTGYAPTALAAMRAQSTDNNAANYQNAQRALNAKIQTQGGSDQLGSGVNSQLYAGLLESEARDQTSDQNQITLANEERKQQNYWSAINGLNGVGAEFNPQSYAGQATGAGEGVADLSRAVTASRQTGFTSAFTGAFGSSLGKGLGTALGGPSGEQQGG